MTKKSLPLIVVTALAVITLLPVLAPTFTTAVGASACVQQCNDLYTACRRAENARHKAATQACGSDRACRQAERSLHRSNLRQCRANLHGCKDACV